MVRPERILLARSTCSDTARQSLKLMVLYLLYFNFAAASKLF
jgi:hypothetical protein